MVNCPKIFRLNRVAFTLVELLVSIVIIGILLTISIPSVMAVRNSARRVACQNKMRQIGIALALFESSHHHFPSGRTSERLYEKFSWAAQILPYIEQEPLWNQITRGKSVDSIPDEQPAHHLGLSTLLYAVQCPSDPKTATLHRASHLNGTFVALTDYLGVAGQNFDSKDGVFYLDSKTKISQIKDGLSNTFFIGERPPSPDNNIGWWFTGDGQDGTGNLELFLGMAELNSGLSDSLAHLGPGPFRFKNGDPDSMESLFHFWSYHSGGGNFLIGDGSVQFFPYMTDQRIMLELSTVH